MDQVLALLVVLAFGLAIGRVSIGGMTLGTSGVIFAALAAGHFGFEVPASAGSIGVILFVYCLGIGAGPSFLRMFVRQGKSLAVMAVTMIGSAGVVTWLFAKLFGWSPDLASGLFAGSLTSTPALAAAVERLPENSQVAVGFGVAYPFGVVGVILFVQLAPRLAKTLFERAKPEDEEDWILNLPSTPDDEGPITRVLVEITNPGVVGKRPGEIGAIAYSNCQISRVLELDRLKPITSDFTVQMGQKLLLVGAKRRLDELVEILGKRSDETSYTLDVERQRRRVVVTSSKVVGRTLEQLHLLSRFGVTISRIVRQDVEFVPSAKVRIQRGDALTVIGEPASLEKFVQFAGHRERTLDETNLVSLAVGLILGILLGRVEFKLNDASLSLGLAGGPLLVGLILGHIGHFGPLVGHIPRPARLLLGDIGLALFLAQAGSSAGGNFVTVVREQGIMLCLASLVIVTVPMIVGLIVAAFGLRLGLLETLGGLCGAMTSTPGLGAVATASESDLPATSYATVYPLALVLITILAPILISSLS